MDDEGQDLDGIRLVHVCRCDRARLVALIHQRDHFVIIPDN
jgi:hypothetical protein